MTADDLPALNATLNAGAGLALLGGFILIRRGAWRGHAAFMLGACALSLAFLISYLTLHHLRPPRSSTVHGPILRPLYLAILISHSVLAALIVPLAATLLLRALRRRWPAHRRLARKTLPLWLYVSATGIIVYWILYRL